MRSTIFLTLLTLTMTVTVPMRSALADAGDVPSATTQSATAPASDAEYLRFVPAGTDGGTLQAATVRFTNAKGQIVDLIAAVHVADPAFYKALNEQFTHEDALLYEMIMPRDMAIAELHDPNRPSSWITMFQHFLQNTLKLQFQLDAINYDAANFVHADLDTETFTAMQDQRGESITGLMLQSMLRSLSDPDMDNDPTGGVGPLLLALNSPDHARGLKLMLAKQFSKMDDLLADLEGPDGSVLLTERNKAAMAVVAKELAAGKQHIGVFYGAGHLRGMATILTEQMGFKRVGPPLWRVAWDMNASPTTVPTTMPTAGVPATRAP